MNFVRVSSACPVTKVADIDFNLNSIKECIDMAEESNSKVIVFPELSITSYSLGDLFTQRQLLNKSKDAIKTLCEYSQGKDMLIVVGAPFEHNYALYNCAYIIFNGSLLGMVPKTYVPNYSEFYEKRWFAHGRPFHCEKVHLDFQRDIPFGTNLIFKCNEMKFAFEICEDLWVTIPPSSFLSLMGANVIGNLSASNELV